MDGRSSQEHVYVEALEEEMPADDNEKNGGEDENGLSEPSSGIYSPRVTATREMRRRPRRRWTSRTSERRSLRMAKIDLGAKNGAWGG